MTTMTHYDYSQSWGLLPSYFVTKLCNISNNCDQICKNLPYGHILHTVLLLNITT